MHLWCTISSVLKTAQPPHHLVGDAQSRLASFYAVTPKGYKLQRQTFTPKVYQVLHLHLTPEVLHLHQPVQRLNSTPCSLFHTVNEIKPFGLCYMVRYCQIEDLKERMKWCCFARSRIQPLHYGVEMLQRSPVSFSFFLCSIAALTNLLSSAPLVVHKG